MPLLSADELDGAPMHDRHDQSARLRAPGDESARQAPDAEERFLHHVLSEQWILYDPQRETVGRAAVPVVQLAEREIVGARDERLIRKMSEIARQE